MKNPVQQPEPSSPKRRQFTLRYLLLEVLWIGASLGAFRIACHRLDSLGEMPDFEPSWGLFALVFWRAIGITVIWITFFASAGAAIGGVFHAMRTGAVIGVRLFYATLILLVALALSGY